MLSPWVSEHSRKVPSCVSCRAWHAKLDRTALNSSESWKIIGLTVKQTLSRTQAQGWSGIVDLRKGCKVMIIEEFLGNHIFTFLSVWSQDPIYWSWKPIRTNIHHLHRWSVCQCQKIQSNRLWVTLFQDPLCCHRQNAWGVETFGQNNIYYLSSYFSCPEAKDFVGSDRAFGHNESMNRFKITHKNGLNLFQFDYSINQNYQMGQIWCWIQSDWNTENNFIIVTWLGMEN